MYGAVEGLVSNALSHAFRDTEHEWTIRTTLRREGKDAVLIVEDNGRGIPANYKPGTGTRLIRALAAQLDGRTETVPASPRGTRQILRFPLELAAPIPAEESG